MGNVESVAVGPPGYKIFKVLKNSPAFRAGLEVYFDNIVEVSGKSFDLNRTTKFTDIIQSHENTEVKLVIFNVRNRAFRDVWLKPHRWSPDHSSLLGLEVKFVKNVLTPVTALRVLDVLPNSSATQAGLQPMKDYLLGTDQIEFGSTNDLLAAMARHIRSYTEGQEFMVYVYNATSETTRTVVLPLTPSARELGCDIGEGLLHRIPTPKMNAHRNAYARYLHKPDERSHTEQYIHTEPVPPLISSPINARVVEMAPQTPHVE